MVLRLVPTAKIQQKIVSKLNSGAEGRDCPRVERLNEMVNRSSEWKNCIENHLMLRL